MQRLLAEVETTGVRHSPVVIKHRRPGPKHPVYDIPAVVQRVVEKKEPLRTVAAVYSVSHEAIHRILLHVQKQGGQQEA